MGGRAKYSAFSAVKRSDHNDFASSGGPDGRRRKQQYGRGWHDNTLVDLPSTGGNYAAALGYHPIGRPHQTQAIPVWQAGSGPHHTTTPQDIPVQVALLHAFLTLHNDRGWQNPNPPSAPADPMAFHSLAEQYLGRRFGR